MGQFGIGRPTLLISALSHVVCLKKMLRKIPENSENYNSWKLQNVTFKKMENLHPSFRFWWLHFVETVGTHTNWRNKEI